MSRSTQSPSVSRGFSLVEVMVVLTILGILIAMAVPRYTRAIEQSRADIAAANLRAIWSAERLYWLENRVYTADLNRLQTLGLLDSAVTGWQRSPSRLCSAPNPQLRRRAAQEVP